MWDYRWANGGPLAAPGKYTVKLNAGGVEQSRAFEIKADPAALADGTTAADLVEQQNFLLRVRDAMAEANQLRTEVQQAMQKAGVQPPPSPGPGEWIGSMKYAHPLQQLYARLVTAPGTYEQGMLDQFSNIIRAEGGADQKIGAEARARFDDLVAEMKAIRGELGKIGR
jgi:hypothetical protein